ncbi:response regulator [Pseudidiomarina taiwanensis]|uniref:DNA-binding response regulator n=1 Tax=Pseudidiomarina taiwanensis TaxID=337250 RepID=A0A432ZCL5_9GAMM|nr:response regulator transcription factor [Pseudidiomarina taiwanensis]RUO75630.1 DNA-binding response regulator [Pseudidiomarina taiwanensis]
MSDTHVYRVLLVDDQMLVRQGLKSLLSLSPEIEVVHDVCDGVEATEWLKVHQQDIDVVLLDIRMPKMNGIETLNAMRREDIETPVLILTTFNDHELLIDALKAGAKGYLLKDVELETLVSGIQRVVRGESMIQPSITTHLLSGLKDMKSDFASFEQPEPLSVKEIEILRLMASGCSNKEIATALFKSEGTVKNQVST